MLRYFSDWRTLGNITSPCYLRIPRTALMRTLFTVCIQAFLYCLLPTPFMLCTLPVGILIFAQFAAWLRVYRRFLYQPAPPALLFAAVWIATLCLRADLHALLHRLYIQLILPLL